MIKAPPLMRDATIGFVGLGNIGQPLSCNLLQAGFRVRGYALNDASVFRAAGGEQVGAIEDLAGLDLVLQSLPSAAAVRNCFDALLPHLKPGAVVVDLTSYDLTAKREQSARLAAHGVTLLDCEVSGLPVQAAKRQAVVFKAGDAAVIEALRPVFDALADRHFYLGAFGAATQMKLIANTMVCVHNLMAAEALAIGRGVGLDPALMVEVLGPSAAGSTTFINKAPLMLSRAFEHGAGPFSHMFGYLARTQEMADSAQVPMPLLRATREVYRQAEALGWHGRDIAAVIELLDGADHQKANA